MYLGFPLLKPSFKPKSLSAIGLGLASGALMAGSMFITYWVFSDVFTPYAPAMLAQLNKSGLSGYYWTFALGISLAHSLFEEYYWRWYMVRGLETRLSPLLATILGNFFFALHHYVILMQFFPMAIVLVLGSLVGIGGCIWSVLYKRTGSLLTTWISHILVDLAIFVIGYWLMF